MSTMPSTRQCPQCGFDLEPGTVCRVCGYDPGGVSAAHEGSAAPSPDARPQARSTGPDGRRRGRRGSVGAIVAASVGLLVVLGAFLGVDLWWHRGPSSAGETAGADAAGAVVAPAPSPTPSPGASAETPAAPAARPVTVASAVKPIAASKVSAPAAPAAPAASAKPAPAASSFAPKPAGVPSAGPPARPPLAVADESAPDVVDHQLADTGPGFDITTRHDDPPTTSRAAFVSWMTAHTDQKEKFLQQKWALAQGIVKSRSITHPRVLEAFLRAPREFFARDTRRAYENAVLPIGYGQTISGPYMVARMTDWLNPEPEQKVLEIGTGSGYQSAVLSELSKHVYTVEIVDPLARETDAIYRKHETRYPEFRNIHRKIDDGYYGWQEHAPFDRIIVTCGIDHVPPELLRELAPGGMMVIPVGPPSGQTILRITKRVDPDGTVRLEREDIFQGKRREIFVPFTNRGGGTHVEKGSGGTP
ncbi:MAG TPA: protein-L-isoaspartate(D-aspartate) O-methyltransferase [Spirochaetia bacterium]